MAGERCPVCGADSRSPSSGDTKLDRHIFDYNDPHRTLSLVPKVYYGTDTPTTTDGYKSGDWYVDLTAKVLYSCAVENSGSDPVLMWIQATTATAVTFADLASALASYSTTAAVSQMLAAYVLKSEATQFVTTQQLDARGYMTAAGVASALVGYVTESSLDSRGYVTAAALASALSSYATSASVDLALTGFYTKEASDSRFAPLSALTGLVTQTALDTRLSQGFVTRQPVSPGVWPELDLDSVLASYLTSESAATTYLTKELAASTYVTQLALSTALAPYTTSASLPAVLAPYLPKSEAAQLYVSKQEASDTYLKVADIPTRLSSYVTASSLAAALTSYYTKAAADVTFAKPSDLAQFVTDATVRSYLSNYVSLEYLDGRLASYLTAAEAQQTYLTPSALGSYGFLTPESEFLANFVRSTTGQTDLDSALAGYAVRVLDAGESRPPQSRVVKEAIDEVDARHDALADIVEGLVMTGGNSDLLREVTSAVTITESGVARKLLKLTDNATNWISFAAARALLGGGEDNRINVAIPKRAVAGVARDFLFGITFDNYRAAAGETTATFPLVRIENQDGTYSKPKLRSYSANPFDLSGVSVGTTVIWGFTEYHDGEFVVTRKVIYPVGGYQ